MIIFSLLSFGFQSQQQTKVNRGLWFDAIFNFLSGYQYYLDNGESVHTSQFNNLSTEPRLTETDIPFNGFFFPHDSVDVKDSIYLGEDADSLILETDTVTTYVDPRLIDSTARVEHFKHKRSDVPYTSLYRKKPSNLYAQPSATLRKRVIEIDSTGKFVEIREKVGDVVVRVPLRIPLEDYINLKLKAREREIWDELVYKYELKDTAMKQLGDIIRNITDFEIPLPSVGVLSILVHLK